MKTFKLLAIALLVSVNVMSQSADMYLSYQPADHGFGARGDFYFSERIGTYCSLSYGDWGLLRYVGLRRHSKATIGILIPVKRYYTDQRVTGTIGFNYHRAAKTPTCDVDYGNYSFELGVSFNIKDRIRLGLRTDILHWEPCIDLGVTFRKPTMRELRNGVCK